MRWRWLHRFRRIDVAIDTLTAMIAREAGPDFAYKSQICPMIARHALSFSFHHFTPLAGSAFHG
jgi:hypothetical protein